ncbi:MAG TPA: hypothetical protein VFU16_07095 [Solirubrobacterales bacterium]|nr:hypothetical protein [Solirubrobacterales bacterium]
MRRILEVSERSGSGEDTAFPESPIKGAARHVAPSLGLVLAIDHEINRYFEATQLPAEPPVLVTTPVEVGLDDESVIGMVPS